MTMRASVSSRVMSSPLRARNRTVFWPTVRCLLGIGTDPRSPARDPGLLSNTSAIGVSSRANRSNSAASAGPGLAVALPRPVARLHRSAGLAAVRGHGLAVLGGLTGWRFGAPGRQLAGRAAGALRPDEPDGAGHGQRDRNVHVQPQAEEVLGRVDPERLLEDAERRVSRDVQGEQARRLDAAVMAEPDQQRRPGQVENQLIQERRVKRAELRVPGWP